MLVATVSMEQLVGLTSGVPRSTATVRFRSTGRDVRLVEVRMIPIAVKMYFIY